jgi:hypothetical protein
VWRNLGLTSYLGHSTAVAESSDKRFRHVGFWAYQLWRTAMFTGLVSLRNKVLVPADRLRAGIFGRDVSKF